MKKFCDTNTLLNDKLSDKILEGGMVISSETLKELENIKNSSNKSGQVKFASRKAIRFLDENSDKYEVVIINKYHYDLLEDFNMPASSDALIIACAYDYNINLGEIVFVSNDLLCRNIAKNIFGLDVDGYFQEAKEPYSGYREICLTDDDMANFYSNMSDNSFGCLVNEYVILKNSNNEIVDKLRWNGDVFCTLKYRQINNDYTGKIKPRNIHQEFAFDLLQNDSIEIKLLLGKFGSGKTFLEVSNALQLIKNRKYEKIMWVRNNIEVKNTKELGFLPGKKTEKLLCYAMPLADHCGGLYGLQMFMNNGEIELEHLGHLRGRDIKNTLIICSEAENMTKEHIQLLIGRIGENSALWLDGDLKQIDDRIFEDNNGLSALIDKLKGNKHFGFVKLEKTERSIVADLADFLD